MSFTLKLGFGGLCLFTHDVIGKKMHVLFPAGHGHDGWLYHDRAATAPGHQPSFKPHRVPLVKALIDLSNLGATPALKPPPPEVAELPASCAVPKDLVKFPGSKVGTRVTFTAGESRIAECGRGAAWDYDGEKLLPIRVVWEIEVATAPAVMLIRGLHSSPQFKKIELYPHTVDGREVVDVWFLHSPTGQELEKLPPQTRRPIGTPSADHFQAFYHMIGCASRVIPTYVREPPDINANCYVDAAAPRGLDVMCIAARAPLG